jgi:acyl carrier protein
MSIEDRLRAFIVDELRSGWVPEEVTDDVHLFQRGIVDSLGLFELVALIEREYGVDVRDDELVADHFQTVSAMAGFVRSKLAVGAQAVSERRV